MNENDSMNNSSDDAFNLAKSEQEVIASWEGDLSKPLVSIVCITYNQEAFIKDTLNGFLMQETDFPFEILIHDDASTDNTAKIIREYEEKYPLLIKSIYQSENQYSKGIKISATFNYPRAKGKYIAYCEGDDYWTDKSKLAKQVAFLNNNLDCSLCFHATRVIFINSNLEESVQRVKGVIKPTKFTVEDFIRGNGLNIRTVGVMIKSTIINDLPEFFFNAPIGDLPLQLFSGINGNYGYIPEVMATYRRGIPGAWSENSHTIAWKKKHIEDLNNIYIAFDKYTSYRYHDLIANRNKQWIRSVIISAQIDAFSRRQQLDLIMPYISTFTSLNLRNGRVFIGFVLGRRGYRSIKKLRKKIMEL